MAPIINTGELAIKGYQLIRADRNVHGGGMAVYIKNEFQTTLFELTSNSESLFLKINNGKAHLFLLVVYRPPNDKDATLLPLLFDEVIKIVEAQNDYLVICGDFNLPDINWTDLTCCGTYNISLPFLSKACDLGLEQHVFEPTHEQGNILDLIFTNKSIVTNVEVLDPLLSDHSIIVIHLNTLHQTKEDEQNTNFFVQRCRT